MESNKISTRRRGRGGFRGGYTRGDIARTEDDARRATEVKYFVRAYRFFTLPRYWTVGTDPKNQFQYSFLDKFDWFFPGGAYAVKDRAGLIGNRLRVKRLTLHIHGTYYLSPVPQNGQVDPSAIYNSNYNDVNPSIQFYFNALCQCIVRIALVRLKTPLYEGTDPDALSRRDSYYQIADVGDSYPNDPDYDTSCNQYPFDPKNCQVLNEQYIPLSLSDYKWGQNLPSVFSIKFSHDIDSNMTCYNDGAGHLINDDGEHQYAIYCTMIHPIIMKYSAADLIPVVTTRRVWRFSYYDV